MRIPLIAFLVTAAACGGGDLFIPGDPDDGVPVELRALSGDGQTAVAGDPVRHPLVVQALDHRGRPVPGAVILFEFVDSPDGAEIAPPNTETDSTGRASAAVTLGTPVGDQPVEARLADAASVLSVQFLLTALRPNRDGGGDDDGEGGEDGGGGNGDGDGDGDGVAVAVAVAVAVGMTMVGTVERAVTRVTMAMTKGTVVVAVRKVATTMTMTTTTMMTTMTTTRTTSERAKERGRETNRLSVQIEPCVTDRSGRLRLV